MNQQQQTKSHQQVCADELLQTDWCYQSTELVHTETINKQSHHRVLPRWYGKQGETLELLLNFVDKPFYDTRVVMPSSNCQPEINDFTGLVDEFGFQLKGYRRRQLIWDLVMRVDLNRVSYDLQSRLASH